MPVPNTFANATATIPLSQLDANFATTITLGNTAIQLGNTVSTLNNMTLANVTVTSGNVTITNVTVTTANVTTANIATAEIANVTVSGTGTFAAGSNTAPSITTSGDTNTGIFFPAADTIAFTEGGVESMRIDSSGNVGIGTSSPANRLGVHETGNDVAGTPTGWFEKSGTATTTSGNQVLAIEARATTSGFQTSTQANIGFYAGRTGAQADHVHLASVGAILTSGTTGSNHNGAVVVSTAAAGASPAERMRIDSSGNLGLGVTPSSWGTSYKAFQILGPSGTVAGALWQTQSNVLQIGNNVYSASGGDTYYSTAAAVKYAQTTSEHRWYNAPSGTAGNAITFTQAMTLDASGNLIVGGTSAPLSAASRGNITINGASTAIMNLTIGGTNKGYIFHDDSSMEVWNSDNSYMRFGTSNAEAARITSNGELLVGGTTEISGAGSTVTIQGTGAQLLYFYRNDTTISSGDAFGQIGFYGNDTTSNTPTLHAQIYAAASGTHAAGDNPTDLVFGCTNDGSGTVAEFARLAQDGASGRKFEIQQATLANSAGSYFKASGGTAGTNNRFGQLGVYKHSGITNSAGFLSVTAEDGADNYLWADNSDVLRISTTITNIGTTGGTVVGTQTSDERIKNIIGPVTYGLEQIKSIEPVEYTLKDDVEQTKRIGFIAQQVQPIVPESVYDTKEVIVEGEPTKLGMEYVALIPVLVKAMQEQQAMIDELKAKVAALENA